MAVPIILSSRIEETSAVPGPARHLLVVAICLLPGLTLLMVQPYDHKYTINVLPGLFRDNLFQLRSGNELCKSVFFHKIYTGFNLLI